MVGSQAERRGSIKKIDALRRGKERIVGCEERIEASATEAKEGAQEKKCVKVC